MMTHHLPDLLLLGTTLLILGAVHQNKTSTRKTVTGHQLSLPKSPVSHQERSLLRSHTSTFVKLQMCTPCRILDTLGMITWTQNSTHDPLPLIITRTITLVHHATITAQLKTTHTIDTLPRQGMMATVSLHRHVMMGTAYLLMISASLSRMIITLLTNSLALTIQLEMDTTHEHHRRTRGTYNTTNLTVWLLCNFFCGSSKMRFQIPFRLKLRLP